MSDQAQAMQALALANTIRTGTKEIRLAVHAGALTVVEAFEDPRAQALPIGRLLCAQRGWGPKKANRLLNRHGIWPTRRVRDLTARQRRVISEAVR